MNDDLATNRDDDSVRGSSIDSEDVPPGGSAALVLLPVPITLAEAVGLALVRHREDRLDEADTIYRAVLSVQPDNADALHFSGVLAHQQDRYDDAIDLIRRALAVIPGHADAHNNLGNILRSLGCIDEAHACYCRAIELAPNNAAAHSNLGVTLRALRRYDEAEAELKSAIALDPDNADFFQNLGNVFRSQKRLHDAVVAYRQAIALRPYNALAYKYLSYTLYALDDREEALRLVRHWAEVAPDNATARHLLAAYEGDGVPERATDEYVRETFRAFAASFDEVLADLDYKAPQLVAETITETLGVPDGTLRVLDLGCGTGLSAETLRRYAATLIGVDLSPDMLKQATRRKSYDALIEAELTDFCRNTAETFDLIIAADTLCYFGRLDDVFTAMARVLNPAGWLIFTLEDAADTHDTAYRLNVHGRYSHRADMVDLWLKAAGFDAPVIRQATLRLELGTEVRGLVVAARRAASFAVEPTSPSEPRS